MRVTLACRLFGHCRQAFYQSKADIVSELRLERVIIGNVREIRGEDPGIGGYKLWVMLRALLGSGVMPGRDSFYTLLRRHGLMLPPRKARHTQTPTTAIANGKTWRGALSRPGPTSYGWPTSPI